jgi:hypothetical protein
MHLVRNKTSILSPGSKGYTKLLRISSLLFAVGFFFIGISAIHAETLNEQLKRFTSVLSNRNLDSLRLLIDPERIYVEIAPKDGSYLSPSQTLGVVEFFFQSHPPITFSYMLVKEEGKNGIAIGTLVVSESGRKISHKVNFGFQKNNRDNWLLSRITIR